MIFMEKRYIYALTAVAFFIVVSIHVNRLINSSLKDKTVEQEGSEDKSVLAPSVKLHPEDPSKYGIVVKKEDHIPGNQASWDAVMKKSFSQADVFNRMKDGAAFAEVKKSSKQIQEKLQRLNDRIKGCEKIKRANPGDTEIENRLQSLYRLKSTLTLLQDKISNSPAKKP